MRMNCREGRCGWCKTVVKISVVLFVCFWLVDYYLYWERIWEARDYSRKQLAECQKKLSNSEYLPILGGGLLEVSRLKGFYWSLGVKSGECVGDNLEGSFWWTGTELRSTYDEVGKKNDRTGWGHFNVAARLYVRKPNNKPHSRGYQNVDWPDELTVKLKNYPGLELWLLAPPPSVENKFAVTNFVLRDWRRRDGTPRLIKCGGLNSSQNSGSGLSRDDLLKIDKSQLENVNFSGLNAYCTVELSSFNFAAGDARISLGTESLAGAPQALKFINDYLSRSLITGSKK